MNNPGLQLPPRAYGNALNRVLVALHRAHDFPTKLRLLGWLDIALGRKRIVASTQAGTVMALDRADLIQRALLYDGVYEPELLEFLDSEVRDGDVFYDVGANCGFFSCMAGCKPNVLAIAFEPDPLSAAVIRLNAELNAIGNEALRVFEMALANFDGEALFYRAHVSNTGLSGLHVRDAVETFPVRVATLRTLMAGHGLPPPTIIKMDVEGAEAKVLQGLALETLPAPPRVIVFESLYRSRMEATSEAANILRNTGYDIRHLTRKNGSLEVNENFVARRAG